jgi:hypothetical protein
VELVDDLMGEEYRFAFAFADESVQEGVKGGERICFLFFFR